jgi:hypothetical protein
MTKTSITRMLFDEGGVSVPGSVSSIGRSKARKKKKDSDKPILSAVTAEMAKPRVAMSARVASEDAMKN